MSEQEFERLCGEWLAALEARRARLRAALAGKATVRRVRVRAYSVRAYRVPAHHRYLITPGAPS